jgi:hypothetical protein
MSKLDRALILAARGDLVFPLLPNAKTPRVKGWQRWATDDAAKIVTHWTAHPDDNIGTLAERDRHGARVIVDIDRKAGKDWRQSLLALEFEGCELLSTSGTETPNGTHLYYRSAAPVKQGVNVLGDGLDVRSQGGYCVAPGSVIDGREYVDRGGEIAPAPEWLIERCGKPRERVKADEAPVVTVDAERALARGTRYLRDEAPIAIEGKGGDATTFKVAARCKDLGLDRDAACRLMLEIWNERCVPPWLPDDLHVKVDNAYTYGVEKPGVADPAADFPPVTVEETKPAPSRSRKIPVVSFSEIKLDAARRPLVKGWLPQGGTSMVIGASGAGKTHFVLDLAVHVALGRAWHSCRVEQGAVIYIAAESPWSVTQRLLAIRKEMKLEGGVPLDIIPYPVNLADGRGDITELVALIGERAKVHGVPVRLVVVDTAARTMPGADENTAKDASAFINQIDTIRDRTGAHVLVVHHLGKDESKGARGSSALKAAVDTEITIKSWTATLTKQRDGAMGGKVEFSLKDVVIGQDIDGELIEAPVVVHATTKETYKVKPIRAGSYADRALKALRTVIDKEGMPAKEMGGADALFEGPGEGEKVVRIGQWRHGFAGQKRGVRSQADTVERSFRRAVETLVPGHVGRHNEFVWLQ